MSIYHKIYNNLCSVGVNKKSYWELKELGYHRHHIIPKHSGGSNEENNFTYLTVREHIIAHYLLWKLHRKPNDLRAMHMLGAKLTPTYRRIVGVWCKENGIGIWNPKHKKDKSEWCKRGAQTQIKESIGIHNPENFKKYASIGGKVSILSDKNPWKYWASDKGRRERAKLGGLSHIGKKWIFRNNIRTRCKISDLKKYLSEGWQLGTPNKNSTKTKDAFSGI